jgi:polysaccharide biosynthesis protein PslJ
LNASLAPDAERARRTPGIDTVAVLTVWLLLLLSVPGRLVVEPLGKAGTPATILAVGMAAWWVCTRIAPELGGSRGFCPVRVGIWALAGAVLLGYVAASSAALDPVARRGADRGIVQLVAWSGIALVTADGITSRDRLDTLLRRLVAGAAVLGGLGIYEALSGTVLQGLVQWPLLSVNQEVELVLEQRGAFLRPVVSAVHPIEYGVVLAVSAPLVLHFALSAPRHERGRWWTAFGLVGVALLLSLSRAAMLALGVAAVVLVPTWPWRTRFRALAVLPIAVLGSKSLVPGLLRQFADLFVRAGDDPSYLSRVEDYTIVGRLVSESPFVGRGMGSYIVPPYPVLDNQYLVTLVEMGAVGLLALVCVFGSAVAAARGARRRLHTPVDRHLAQSLLAAVVAAAVSFATFDALAFPTAAGLTFLVVGLTGALWRLSRSEQASSAASVVAAVPHR